MKHCKSIIGLSILLMTSSTDAFMTQRYDIFTAWALRDGAVAPSSPATKTAKVTKAKTNQKKQLKNGATKSKIPTTKTTASNKNSMNKSNKKRATNKINKESPLNKNTNDKKSPHNNNNKKPAAQKKSPQINNNTNNSNTSKNKKSRPQQNLKKKQNVHPRVAAKMQRVAAQRKKAAKADQNKRRENNRMAMKQYAATMSSGKDNETDDVYRNILVDMVFDMIDANKDGGITNDELVDYLKQEVGVDNSSIRYLFTALDTNADGHVSREELQFAFANYETPALYRAFGLGSQTTQELYQTAVKEIRTDSMGEEDDKSKQTPELLTKLADFIFNIIDEDGSGEIDVDELRTHFKEQQIMDQMIYNEYHPSDNSSSQQQLKEDTKSADIFANEKVESILEALDLNHDGVISREEMRQGFQQYNPRTLSEALGLPVL